MVPTYRERYQAMVKKLKDNSHKLTPQRLAIIRILAGSENHPSVEDIYNLLHKRFPGISQATVYRNIMLIKSLGEVLEIGFAGASTRYDGIKPFPHPHVVCLKCNKIIDPELASLHDMTKEITDESGFEIVTFRLDFFGVCPECRAMG
ncbi:MAG TPA: transcriptional repressor [Syntrophorhabdus sp.]|jgi:Fur family peroxide stress response transcriptional regulator|nr:transcriptional repressor [Syntrophorhabdus sp.]MDI9557589.1 transcriptional repressor [Pseudomonadota bacterium]OQB73993.1 MAG: Peroxide-responsive repressor PerR [Deltaproteobacteria bacterium ADurb.Bin135]NMC95353.1 transcriptional repressor [Syntrophorhabdus sp.]HNQ47010.1 transcriptional repressor [Syntrophorhabdus sp.]